MAKVMKEYPIYKLAEDMHSRFDAKGVALLANRTLKATCRPSRAKPSKRADHPRPNESQTFSYKETVLDFSTPCVHRSLLGSAFVFERGSRERSRR